MVSVTATESDSVLVMALVMVSVIDNVSGKALFPRIVNVVSASDDTSLTDPSVIENDAVPPVASVSIVITSQ